MFYNHIPDFPGEVKNSSRKISSLSIFLFLLLGSQANSQTLTLKEAVDSALTNYGTIKAKGSYLKASEASVKQASSVYLPNLKTSLPSRLMERQTGSSVR